MSEKETVGKGTKAKAKKPQKEIVQNLRVAPSSTSSLQIAPSLTQSLTQVTDVAPTSSAPPLAIASGLSISIVIPAAVVPTGRKSAPTVDSIILDPITHIASQHWAPDAEVINCFD